MGGVLVGWSAGGEECWWEECWWGACGRSAGVKICFQGRRQVYITWDHMIRAGGITWDHMIRAGRITR